MPCEDVTVATVNNAEHVYSVSVAYARTTSFGAAVYLFAHRWPRHWPHAPVLALAPVHMHVRALWCASCCSGTLVDAQSAGRHAVLNVSRCDNAASPLHPFNLTVGLTGAPGVRSIHLDNIDACAPNAVQSKRVTGGVGVCLGPTFGSAGHAAVQRLLWERWLHHTTVAAGVERVFAYGLDEAAHQFFGGQPANRALVYSSWPQRWHALVGLPVHGGFAGANGNASHAERTHYATQALVLQRCLLEHGESVEWLLSVDTDEFWRGAVPLADHLRATIQHTRATTSGAVASTAVVELCRGQRHPNGSWASLAAPKYAMRPAACRDEWRAFAWVHFGFCPGKGSTEEPPVAARIFEPTALLERCGGREPSEELGYLDHAFRYCVMGAVVAGWEAPSQIPLCPALRCYPAVAYNGQCGHASTAPAAPIM